MVLIGSIDMDDPISFTQLVPSITSLLLGKTFSMNTIETLSPDQKKFSFTFTANGETSSYNIYINHSNDIPDQYFVWDYYGSGELYCNFRKNNLMLWKDSFPKLFTSYFLNSKLSQPHSSGLDPYTFALSIPFHDRYVWSFVIDTFFTYEKLIKESPVCTYFTLSTSEVTVVSDHYQFANLVDSTPCCSHPTVSSSTKHSHCQFYPGNSTCPLYSSSSRIVSSRLVDLENTSNQILFNLTYSMSDSFSHIFEITNQTADCIVNVMKYPSSLSYDEVLSESIQIFDSYVSSYANSNCQISDKEVSSQDTNKDKPRTSYIESLIGV